VRKNNKYFSNQQTMKIPLITSSNEIESGSDANLSSLSQYEMKRRSTLSEFMIRDDRICKNQSPFYFGDFVQLFITFSSVSSHPLSYYDDSDEDRQSNDDSELETDVIDCFGGGQWVDGVIMNVYEGKVLVRYYYESALYQQWIDCDIEGAVCQKFKILKNAQRRVTIQPLIRLRHSLSISSHLNHILAHLNVNALSEWRLRLNKSCVCFACDGNGIWAKAIIRRRFGCFVFVHWLDFDAKYDQYISIHSQRIQPLNASDLCNRFRSQLKFENILQIKPPKIKVENLKKCKPKMKSEGVETLESKPKKAAFSNIFKSLVLHLVPES